MFITKRFKQRNKDGDLKFEIWNDDKSTLIQTCVDSNAWSWMQLIMNK